MDLKTAKTAKGVLNGKISPDGETMLVGTIEEGLKVVELVKVNFDDVKDLIKEANEIYQEIRYFFLDLFNNLPSIIRKDGQDYRLNLLPSPGRTKDVVLYRSINNPEHILFLAEGRNMMKAKNEMFQILTDENYIF